MPSGVFCPLVLFDGESMLKEGNGGEHDASLSQQDRDWLERIEQTVIDFHNLKLISFKGTITTRDIVRETDEKGRRFLRVSSNTVYRFNGRGGVSMMIDGESRHVGIANRNNHVRKASRNSPTGCFDSLNYPGRRHGIDNEYFIRPAKEPSDA